MHPFPEISRLPLHKSRLASKDWDFLLANLKKILQNWKGHILSIGGKLTLISSVLSPIPLYILSIFKIPKYVIQQLDRIRCRFLWQGSSKSMKKYALVNWTLACLSTKIGDLGILDLKQMNIALLLK